MEEMLKQILSEIKDLKKGQHNQGAAIARLEDGQSRIEKMLKDEALIVKDVRENTKPRVEKLEERMHKCETEIRALRPAR